jgi:spore germination protein YaaH/putative cell wall-binding protein
MVKRCSSNLMFLAFVLFLTNLLPWFQEPVLGALSTNTMRLAGQTRYETAIQISQAGWSSADTVVLARGDDFPDALAGSVLAHSSKVYGPLLLTESSALTPSVFNEIKRLGTQTVYILGGTGAVSQSVEDILKSNGLKVIRLAGRDRYETAANISLSAVSNSTQAFLACGLSFADTLSVASYGAAKGIPLLLTESDHVPIATANTLKSLGVKTVTLVGGTGIITPAVENELKGMNMSITRFGGSDRYATNLAILNSLDFNQSEVFVATGQNFPDALAGASLAAKNNNPMLLTPYENWNVSTASFLTSHRDSGSHFTLLGGTGVVSSALENLVSTFSTDPRISLQYLQGSSVNGLLNQLNYIPNTATDSVNVVSPDWFTLVSSDGTVQGPWDGTNNYNQIVSATHQRDLKILPLVNSSWTSTAVIDSVLSDPVAREKLVTQLVERIQTTNSDGVVVDFEFMGDNNGPYLTEFMRSLYGKMHSQGKLVVMAVMARTSNNEYWLNEFNYHDLSQYVDYLNIMTYDYSYSTPGPIAPISWMKSVINYTQSQGVNMKKVLLGIPYYGRDWSGANNSEKAIGLYEALSNANKYNSPILRLSSPYDPVGVPYYNYLDANNVSHTVYFDDPASWVAKLELVKTYDLGGIGAWSLYWTNGDTPSKLFPLLKQYLR